MPTATTLSGFSLTNIGPLTTTFTAPASCTTAGVTVLRDEREPQALQYDAECEMLQPVDCNPSGSAIQSLDAAAQGTNPTGAQVIAYHSPGLACPAGWSVVGAASKVNPTSTSMSGAFDVSIPTGTHPSFFKQPLDLIMAALGPSETAVVCCPSSFSTTGAGCYSALPTSVYAPTGGCAHIFPPEDVGTVSGTFTIGGQPVTGNLLTITGTVPISRETTSFSDSEATHYIGLAVNKMYILVHQASDGTGEGSPATADATGSTASTAPNPTKSNAAVRARGSADGLGVGGIVLLTLALGALFVV